MHVFRTWTLLKVLNNLADIKSAGGVALRVRTQVVRHIQSSGVRTANYERVSASARRSFFAAIANHDCGTLGSGGGEFPTGPTATTILARSLASFARNDKIRDR
jgi:hypothetical protein